MNFTQAAESYLSTLTDPQRRRPLSPNSVRQYTSHTARLIEHLKDTDCALVCNGIVRAYIAALQAEQLSPATIVGIYSVLRQIVYSVRDFDGARIYQQQFDADFLKLPLIKPAAQKHPSASKDEIERATPLVKFLAATGLRVSEALSLSTGEGAAGNVYDPEAGVVHLRENLKTPAAARSVFLPSNFRNYINLKLPASGRLFPMSYQQVHADLQQAALPPCHSYRRFRATHLRKVGMNESVLKAQLGHSESGVTSRYDRSGFDVAFIRSQVESAGVGFSVN